MSNKYIVDTDVVDKAVEDLKKLQNDCLSYYNMKIPESTYDLGQTHYEIQMLHENLKENWRKFDELISKTIEFLGKDSETIIISDKNSANALQGGKSTSSSDNSYNSNSGAVNDNEIKDTLNNYGYNGITYTLTNDFNPSDYSYDQYDPKYNGSMSNACSLFAMASCLSIISKKQITPENLKAEGSQYWGSNGCTWKGSTSDTRSGSNTGGYSAIVDSVINQHKPCVIELSNSSTGTHFVSVVGICSGADYNNLSASDILCLDPASGSLRTLTEVEVAQASAHRYRTFNSKNGRVITF